LKIAVIKGTVIEERNVFVLLIFIFMVQHPWNLTFMKWMRIRHTYCIYVYFAGSRCIIINLTNIFVLIFKSAILKISTYIIKSLLGSHCIKKKHFSCRSRHYTCILCSWKRRAHLFHAADVWTVLSNGSAFQAVLTFKI